MLRLRFIVLVLVTGSLLTPALHGQVNARDQLAGQLNPIQTAVPFMIIAPDSRAGGMGDIGTATSPDANSIHWNSAKYGFIETDMAVSVSYTPWLRALVNDINLAYLTAYKRLDRQQVIAGSLRYFSLGEIIFTDDFGEYQGQHTPNEFALAGSYSRLFSDRFSGGITFKFIRSDLTGGTVTTSGGETKAGTAFAADISTYYQNDVDLGDKFGRLAFGLNIANMGNPISYAENQDPDFLPTTLRLGSSLRINMDDFNTMTFAADFSKLLIPTPPVFYDEGDTLPSGEIVAANDEIIQSGLDPDVSVPLGMLQSFYDAPGGFKEELNEFIFSLGAEYWYRNQFAIRAGYFHEHENKGNRKYFTMGIGLQLNVFGLDFAYLIPTAGRTNPLANTVRFTLSFNFDNM
jgi:hypothetical protein